MITHPEEGHLQALLDGELAEVESKELRRHLEVCGACAGAFDALRATGALFAGAMVVLDPPRTRIPLPPPSTRISRPSRWGAALPRAAVLVFGFAAAASAAIPGSPVRGWLERLTSAPEAAMVAVAEPEPVPVPEARAVATQAAPESGVSVAPAGGEVRVVIRGASPELRLRALVTDGDRAWAIATGDAAEARFQTAAGRIEITGAGAGELRIELPRALLRATIEVDGVTYLTKEGGRLDLAVPAEDSAATEVTFRARRQP